MTSDFTRRNFLAAGLAVPAANLPPLSSEPQRQAPPNGFRTLGKTGLKVSQVGFGCMITSDPAVIARALDLGINYFDTARNYQGGNNERMVGAALGARRKNVVLASKTEAVNKQGALEQLETSLKTIGTDYLDIWFLHGKDSPAGILDELVEAQEIARKQGKVRFIGVSTHRLGNITDAVLKARKMEVVLTTYNFTMTGGGIDANITALSNAGIGVVAMKVMAGGTRARGRSAREGLALAALKWTLKNNAIATTIPSMTDADQLQQNFGAMSGGFSEADQKLLTARSEEIRPVYCRMCGACDGKCPKGLPASDLLRCLTYADGYGQFALGRERFLSVAGKRAAIRCRDCASCAIECPNGVNVAGRLARAQELFV